MSYLKVSTDGIINTTNNETTFSGLTRFFEERFEIKVQEGPVLRYLNYRIFQSSLGFSVDHTYHIIEPVSELFSTRTFRKFDTPFRA